MASDHDAVEVHAENIDAAIPLAEPVPESRSGSYRVTTLRFSGAEPSRFGRLLGGGNELKVTVDPSPVEGGAWLWSTQAKLPKGSFADASARVGLEWPLWWAIPDMTHVIERARHLEFVAFATPESALPWFVRLHALVTDTDPYVPITPIGQGCDGAGGAPGTSKNSSSASHHHQSSPGS